MNISKTDLTNLSNELVNLRDDYINLEYYLLSDVIDNKLSTYLDIKEIIDTKLYPYKAIINQIEELYNIIYHSR